MGGLFRDSGDAVSSLASAATSHCNATQGGEGEREAGRLRDPIGGVASKGVTLNWSKIHFAALP